MAIPAPTLRTALLMLVAAVAGAVGGGVFASPRSSGWIFNASAADTAGWLTAQTTATSVGGFVVVLTYALWSWFGIESPRSVWVSTTVAAIIVTFVKVAVPQAASVDVLLALHVLKSVAAGVLIGTAAYGVRRSRPGWIAIAGGMFGGYLLAATNGVVDLVSHQYVPSIPFSSSVFGEPAWWLLVAAVVTGVVATVLPPQSPELGDGLSRSVAVRLVIFAAIVAVIGRVGAGVVSSRINEPGYGRWVVAAVAVAAFVIAIDVIGRRWDHLDARVPLAAVAITASSVSLWSALRAQSLSIPLDVILVAAVVALIVGVIAARIRFAPVIALVLLAVGPLVSALYRSSIIGVVLLFVTALGATMLIGSVRIPADEGAEDDSVRAFAIAIPGMAGVLSLTAMLPGSTFVAADLPALVTPDAATTPLLVVDPFGPVDRFGHALMLAVVLYAALRMAASRAPKSS